MSEHTQMVTRLLKSGEAIRVNLTAEDANLIHLTMGISGEAGELLDAIKKAVIYRKPLDRKNVIEELGDLEFFLEGFRQAINVSREETLEANIEKLDKKRYKEGYSDEAAITRADKAEDENIHAKAE